MRDEKPPTHDVESDLAPQSVVPLSLDPGDLIDGPESIVPSEDPVSLQEMELIVAPAKAPPALGSERSRPPPMPTSPDAPSPAKKPPPVPPKPIRATTKTLLGLSAADRQRVETLRKDPGPIAPAPDSALEDLRQLAASSVVPPANLRDSVNFEDVLAIGSVAPPPPPGAVDLTAPTFPKDPKPPALGGARTKSERPGAGGKSSGPSERERPRPPLKKREPAAEKAAASSEPGDLLAAPISDRPSRARSDRPSSSRPSSAGPSSARPPAGAASSAGLTSSGPSAPAPSKTSQWVVIGSLVAGALGVGYGLGKGSSTDEKTAPTQGSSPVTMASPTGSEPAKGPATAAPTGEAPQLAPAASMSPADSAQALSSAAPAAEGTAAPPTGLSSGAGASGAGEAAAPPEAQSTSGVPTSAGGTSGVSGSGTTPPSPTSPPIVTAPTNTATAPFDKSAASAALGGAAGQAAACKQPGDPSGSVHVNVTFAPSGRVTTALLSGPPFAGTATGSCIARAFKSASIPPFAGDPQTVSKTVSIP